MGRGVFGFAYACARRLYPGINRLLAAWVDRAVLERVLFEQSPVRQSFGMTHDVLRDVPPPQNLHVPPPIPFYKLMPWLYRTNAFVTTYIAEHAVDEGLFLYEQCRQKADGTLVEVGRRVGGSTIVMAAALGNGVLHSLDILPLNDKTLRAHLEKLGLAGKVKIVVGDSTSYRAPELARIDLLFLDGNKESDAAIQADLDNFLPLMGPGSLLLIHDMNEPPVQRTVARLVRDGFDLIGQVGLLVGLQKRA